MEARAKTILELCKKAEGFEKNKGLRYFANTTGNKVSVPNMFLNFFKTYHESLLKKDFSFLYDEKTIVRIFNDKENFIPISYIFQTLKEIKHTQLIQQLEFNILNMIAECIHFRLLTEKEESVFTLENIDILKNHALSIEGKPDECINGVKDGLMRLMKNTEKGMDIKSFMLNALKDESLINDITGMSRNIGENPDIIHKFTDSMIKTKPQKK